jgi:uncharacterized protein (TIGR03083 family)
VALPRTDVIEGTTASLNRFEALLRSLDDQAWQAPTRCEGWRVADVAAHVVGNMAIIAEGRSHEFGDPAHVDREVDARKGRTPNELADELSGAAKIGQDFLALLDDNAWNGPPPADIPGTLGQGVEAIWYDVVVHTDDIRNALGKGPERNPADLRVSVSHIADVLDQQDYKPTTIALDGVEEFTVKGGGEQITGDPYDFILVATGRKDAASMGLDETINIYRPQ